MATRRAASKKKQLSAKEMLEQLNEGIRGQAHRPNLYAYRPHDKQYAFHTSEKHTRLYIGGNRTGKTVGGAVETCYWLMKKHPYRRLPLPEGPIRGRAVAVDFNYGVDMLMLPEISRWLPPSFLINGSWEDSYDKEHRVLSLANKSFLEFRSYDQDLEKFAGASRHFTWLDEEPPKHIYDECMARHVDTNGFTWITMTPVEGMSWVFDEIYEPGSTMSHPDIDIIEIEMTENPHLDKESIDRFLSGLSEDDRKARERGEFVAVGGRVYSMFNEKDHVIDTVDIEKIRNWEWFVSFDHGYNNPTAILWHAVSPDNRVVTFEEHYASEMTVGEHAEIYHATNARFKRQPDYVVGDPAMHQRNGVTGTSIVQEYADRGIYIAEGNNDVLSGVNRIIQYLRIDSEIGYPRWQITANCPNLINEMKKLRWQTFASRKMQYENNKQEKIKKKDDHACDSARYFFSFMPDLTPAVSEPVALKELEDRHASMIGANTGVAVAGKWDELVKAQKTSVVTDDWEYAYGEDLYG